MQGGRDEGILDFNKCRHCAWIGGGGLIDQPTRLLEFHMLYGTKNGFYLGILGPFFTFETTLENFLSFPPITAKVCYSRCFMVLFPQLSHLNPTVLNVVGSLLTAKSLQESHQVRDEVERWRHRWINDKSQPDLGPGVQPHIAFLLSNIGNRVVEETNTDVDQNNDDNHLQTKLIERTDLYKFT